MSEFEVVTEYGPGRLVLNAAAQERATVLLSHGAGNGIDTRDLEALAADLPGAGISVARFEQPWKVAGRKVATPPPTLDIGLQAACRELPSTGPLIVGGRSAGARSAARSAVGVGAVGVLALAFPLHPPGKPEKSRLAELRDAGVPTLVVQGEKDPMGRPDEFPEETNLVVIPGADHGLKVPKRGELSEADSMNLLVEAVVEWLDRQVIG